MFQTEQVCLRVIRPNRGRQVMGDHRPQIWVSDSFSAQKVNPAVQCQVCLIHQLRDCQYAIDAGDNLFAPRMKLVAQSDRATTAMIQMVLSLLVRKQSARQLLHYCQAEAGLADQHRHSPCSESPVAPGHEP